MSRNARTTLNTHARPGARNRDAGSAPLPFPPASDCPRLRSAGEVSQFLGVPISTLHQWRYPGRGPAAFRVGKHLGHDPDVVRRPCASLTNVPLLYCGQPVGQRASGRARCTDRRGSNSTDTHDRAVSLVVGAGDLRVEHCSGVPPKPLTGPCVLGPSPSQSPAASHVYPRGAATVADPAATEGICGQSRHLGGSCACATGRSVAGQPPEAPVAPVLRAGSVTDLMAMPARRRWGVKRPTARWAGPRHAGLHEALAVRAWPAGCARPDGASHGLSHPHLAERLTTRGARPRPLAARRPCAFGAAPSSVARGARLTAASCFHTLVSPIRRTAGLRAGAVRVARRAAVQDRFGGRAPACLGRCAGC